MSGSQATNKIISLPRLFLLLFFQLASQCENDEKVRCTIELVDELIVKGSSRDGPCGQGRTCARDVLPF